MSEADIDRAVRAALRATATARLADQSAGAELAGMKVESIRKVKGSQGQTVVS